MAICKGYILFELVGDILYITVIKSTDCNIGFEYVLCAQHRFGNGAAHFPCSTL